MYVLYAKKYRARTHNLMRSLKIIYIYVETHILKQTCTEKKTQHNSVYYTRMNNSFQSRTQVIYCRKKCDYFEEMQFIKPQ